MYLFFLKSYITSASSFAINRIKEHNDIKNNLCTLKSTHPPTIKKPHECGANH